MADKNLWILLICLFAMSLHCKLPLYYLDFKIFIAMNCCKHYSDRYVFLEISLFDSCKFVASLKVTEAMFAKKLQLVVQSHFRTRISSLCKYIGLLQVCGRLTTSLRAHLWYSKFKVKFLKLRVRGTYKTFRKNICMFNSFSERSFNALIGANSYTCKHQGLTFLKN